MEVVYLTRVYLSKKKQIDYYDMKGDSIWYTIAGYLSTGLIAGFFAVDYTVTDVSLPPLRKGIDFGLIHLEVASSIALIIGAVWLWFWINKKAGQKVREYKKR